MSRSSRICCLMAALAVLTGPVHAETEAEGEGRRAEIARLLSDGVIRVDERGYVRLAEFVGRDPEDLLCFLENTERGAAYEARARAEGRPVEEICREAGAASAGSR